MPKEKSKAEILQAEKEQLITEVNELKGKLEAADPTENEAQIAELTEDVTALKESVKASETRAIEAENKLGATLTAHAAEEDELVEKTLVYKAREPHSYILKPMEMGQVKQPDGTFKEIPLPGHKRLIAKFVKSDVKGEYKAIFVLNASIAHGEDTTVSEFKKQLEQSFKFRRNDIIFAGIYDSDEKAKIAAGQIIARSGPEMIAGATPSGAVGR